MKRLATLVCGLILLLGPAALLAQRRGGRGGGRPSAGTAPTDDMKDFKRAIALQASPDQIEQFRLMAKTTQDARNNAEDFLKIVQTADRPDLSTSATHLADALEDAQADHAKFLQSFSPVQKSELKEETKKLSKANSEITKQNKTLARGVERPRVDNKQIAAAAERLSKALVDFQTRQHTIGSAMGIQDEQSSQ
jgi:hypothetical protein